MIVVLILVIVLNFSFAQTVIDVNVDLKHQIGSVAEFDRSKFITIHSDHTEGDWTITLLEEFIDSLDVYFGRNTGTITWYLNNSKEAQNRPGHVDRDDVLNRCQEARNYRNTSLLYQMKKKYESRCKNLIVAGQLDPFWPLRYPTSSGWKLSSADSTGHPFGSASGEYMALFIKNYYDENFHPKWIEVINEPAYWLIDHPSPFNAVSMELINKYHNTVADCVHVNVPNALVGGYTVAFPDYYKFNFERWLERDKLFIDQCGNRMDFWPIHLYDLDFGKRKRVYTGSYIEAVFDIIDHYSTLTLGSTKPFVISEFGGRALNLENGPWSPLRDWIQLKSISPMLMQFMDRANEIGVAVPFIVIKGEWGYKDYPYPHRLLRKENEPDSYTGDWVYTEMIKFYQLWKDVKGIRVDSYSTNIDILCDAYVNDNTLYIILSNLTSTAQKFDVKLNGNKSNRATKLCIRHLYLDKISNVPVLSEVIVDSLRGIEINPEATMVITVEFEEEIQIDNQSIEKRYYADKYFHEITANQPIEFNINDVEIAAYREAVLRLGIGRPYSKSRQPIIEVNGMSIEVGGKLFKGYDQKDHYYFFGVLEIPIPYEILQSNNVIKVSFGDDGGFVTSCILQTFSFSREVIRSVGAGTNSIGKELDASVNRIIELVESYPNPFNPMTNIRFRLNKRSDVSIKIYDLLGCEVRELVNSSFNAGSHSVVFDGSDLSTGVYIYKVQARFSDVRN